MTPPLRYTTRCAPWYVVIICAALASPFYLAYTLPTDEFTGIGIAITIPATYLLLQLACNTRRVRVYPNRIRVSHGPVPEWLPRTIPRPQIHRCYLQQVVQSSKRRRYADYYVAGVVTRQSEHIRVAGPLPTADAVLASARKFATVLNSTPGLAPLEIQWEQPATSEPGSTWRITVAIWLALFLAAILAGAYWELTRNHRSADPRKLEIPL